MMDRRQWLRQMMLGAPGVALAVQTPGILGRGDLQAAAILLQETVDLRKLLEEAIEAAGGAERLTRLKAQTWRSKIRQLQEDPVVESETRYALEWPDKLRIEWSYGVTLLRVGNKGWTKKGDEILQLGADQLLFLKEDMWINSLRTLLPLRDPMARLQHVPDVEVDGRPTIGMRVSIKGHRDVVLLFAKETRLLAKAEYRSRGLSDPGKLQVIEAFFSDYREVAGTQVPGLVTLSRAGEPYLEIENLDIERKESLDTRQYFEIGQPTEDPPAADEKPTEK
ncbi:MAG: hypothetical protein ACKOGA_04025 [Planctomycetaceae bacterium]